MPPLRKRRSCEIAGSQTGELEGYLPIGRVAKILGLKQHVMRYWESKFDALNPTISNKTRMYNADDIKLFSALQTMLHDKGMTINAVQRMIETDGLEEILKMGTVSDSEIGERAPRPFMLDIDGVAEGRSAAEKTHDAPGKVVKIEDLEKMPDAPASERVRILTVTLDKHRYMFVADRLRSLPKARQRHLLGLRDRLVDKTALFRTAS